MPSRSRLAAPVLVALGILVAVGLVLRLRGIDQTLYGDEYFTLSIITRNGFRGVWDAVYHTSITPPLHYYAAWFSLKLGGDPTELIRLPSIVFGTATIGLVFALGMRIGGARTGLLSAALIALAPFAIWYSDEGRAYATMTFLLVLAVLALLRALAGGSRWWWALYAVAACASLWSHYTAVFVVAVSALWALWAHREHLRAVLFSIVAIGIGYLPWLPGFLEQRQNKNGIEIIDQFAGLSFDTPFAVSGRTLIGHPFFLLSTYPGTLTVVLAVLVPIGAAVALLLARRPALAGLGPALRSEAGLVVLLALATLAGLLLYAAGGTSLFLPRNLSASVPFVMVVLALLVARATELLPPRAGAAVAFVLVALFAVNTIRAQGDGFRRPPYREATERVQSEAAPGDPLVEAPPALQRDARLPSTTLDLYLHPRHKVYLSGKDDPAAFATLRRGHDVFFVVATIFTPQGLARTQPHGGSVPVRTVRRASSVGGPGNLARVSSQSHLDGITPVDVIRYHGAITGRLSGRRITWTLGPTARVVRGAARGRVEIISPAPGPLLVTGWALAGNRPPDWILAFAGHRLVAITAGGVERPDRVRVFGPAARFSGWALSPRPRPAGHLRFFAVRGNRAAEIPLSPAARRAAP